MLKTLFHACLWLVLLATAAGAEKVRLAGAASEIFLVSELAKAYMEKHPGDVIEVRQDSIGAKGAIMGTAHGSIDIGLSARKLLGSERSLGLELIEIARVATVAGVNAESVPVEAITADQLCAVYSGSVRNWSELGGPDAPIRAFTLPEPDCAKGSIRDGLQCFSTLKEAPGVVVMPNTDLMNDAIARNPFTVGFTDPIAVDAANGKIRPLRIDRAAPTTESVATGKWPMIKHFYLVLGKKRTGAMAKFIEFIKSPAGRAVMKKYKAVPVL